MLVVSPLNFPATPIVPQRRRIGLTMERLLLRKAERMFIHLYAQEETCLMAQHVELYC